MDIILDTDVGSDSDDIMALAYLLLAKKKFGVNILAITHSQKTPLGIPLIKRMFDEQSEELPPVGSMVGGPSCDDMYCVKTAEILKIKCPKIIYPPAAKILRKALTETEKCVICAIGPLTNISALLESGPDEISGMSGMELVRTKCEKIVLMAGAFKENSEGHRHAEWNVVCDIAAAKKVIEDSPVPVVTLPYEAGEDMITGIPITEKYGNENCLSTVFSVFCGNKGRHSWDPATLVYAIEGVKDFFNVIGNGIGKVDEKGRTFLTPDKNGKFSYLEIRKSEGETEADAKKRVAEYIDKCSLELYADYGKKDVNV